MQALLGDRQQVLQLVAEEASALARKHGGARRSAIQVSESMPLHILLQ